MSLLSTQRCVYSGQSLPSNIPMYARGLHAADHGSLPLPNLHSSLKIKYCNTHFTKWYFSAKKKIHGKS
uniref:Uncharacterized protein n=1 Tax=Cyanoderma ruficeps TaxID=181631 RepID=A0A8C3QXQ5_9PASS